MLALAMPGFPGSDLALPRLVKLSRQRGKCQCGGGFFTTAETESQHGASRQVPNQCDVTRTGMAVLPLHGAVVGEIAPSIADADEAGAGWAEAVPLSGIACRQGQCKWSLLRPKNTATAMAIRPGVIVMAGTA